MTAAKAGITEGKVAITAGKVGMSVDAVLHYSFTPSRGWLSGRLVQK